MKNYLLTLLAAGCTLAASAAGEQLLVFTDTETYSKWSAENTRITITGEMMTIAPGTADELTLPLQDVRAIGYAEGAGVNTLTADDTPVDVYSPEGVAFGRFQSASEAMRSLPHGIYIFRSQSSTTKIQLR